MKEQVVIREIPLSEIDAFPDHPYQLRRDAEMEQLTESIRANGVLTPAIVHTKKDGRYTLISGHRRKEACSILGVRTMPCRIVELTKDEAVILMVESNFQRTRLLPSEKAFAYKMRLDALKHLLSRMRENQTKGRKFKNLPVEPQLENAWEHLLRSYTLSEEEFARFDDAEEIKKKHFGPLGQGYNSREILAEKSGESSRQIQRYIRLTELIPELLQLVDEGIIALRPAVELSYLGPWQQVLYELIDREQCTPTHAQALRMRRLLNERKMSREAMESIMMEQKPNQKEHLSISVERFAQILPKDLPRSRWEDYLVAAVMHYRNYNID